MMISSTVLHRFLCCLLVLFSCASLAESHASEPLDEAFQCPNCNVIFLNIELLRPEFTGILGSSELTPNIDHFFSKSFIFHDVTAPAGETFLSNTSVLTTTPAHKLNIRPIIIDKFNIQDAKKKEEIKQQLTALTSVATILNDAGYKTISINQGGRAGKAVFLDRGFDESTQWSSDLLFDDMVNIFNTSLKKVVNQKFFILFRPTYLHNHQYRRPADSNIDRLADTRVSNYSYEDVDGSKKTAVLLKRKRNLPVERQRLVERDIYKGQVKYGDSVIQKLFDSIDTDMLEHTIIVLYANHGSGLGDNDIYNHGTAYQSSVNVPLLIRIPGMNQAVHIHQPVTLLSLVPSILKMVNVKAEHMLPIETYDEVVAGKASSDRIFYGRNGFDEYIRYNNWKYMVQYGRFGKLYNLQSDPGETINLVDKERMVSRKLEALLLQHKSTMLKINRNK